jgi:hypothetical protein
MASCEVTPTTHQRHAGGRIIVSAVTLDYWENTLMALLTYVFFARDSSTTPPGQPLTGLIPSWVFLKKLSDSSNLTQPAITEIGSGQYKLAFDPELSGEASGQIDLGASVVNPSDRFIDLVFYLSDSRTNYNLDATVSSRSTYAGGPVTVGGYATGMDPATQILANPNQPVATDASGRVTVGTIQDKSGYMLAANGLDTIQVETGVNVRQALSPILASAAGTLSGAGTGSIVIRGGNTSVTRIIASTDSAGNRSAVTLSLPT